MKDYFDKRIEEPEEGCGKVSRLGIKCGKEGIGKGFIVNCPDCLNKDYFDKRIEELEKNRRFYFNDNEDEQVKIVDIRLDELKKAQENLSPQVKLDKSQAPKRIPQDVVIAQGKLGDVSGSEDTISLKDFDKERMRCMDWAREQEKIKFEKFIAELKDNIESYMDSFQDWNDMTFTQIDFKISQLAEKFRGKK